MSYRFEYTPETPMLSVRIDENAVVLHWFNTTLFSHAKKHQEIDHVFVETTPRDEIDGRAVGIGIFIFRHVWHDFDGLANALITHDYPHIHMPHPSDKDIEAWETIALRDMEDIERFANGEA